MTDRGNVKAKKDALVSSLPATSSACMVCKDKKILARAQKRLQRRFSITGSWRQVARGLDMNHAYVVNLVNHGTVPSNVEVRRKLGLPKVMPSERKPRVWKMIPLMGSEGWELVFFKKPRPKKWRKG